MTSQAGPSKRCWRQGQCACLACAMAGNRPREFRPRPSAKLVQVLEKQASVVESSQTYVSHRVCLVSNVRMLAKVIQSVHDA